MSVTFVFANPLPSGMIGVFLDCITITPAAYQSPDRLRSSQYGRKAVAIGCSNLSWNVVLEIIKLFADQFQTRDFIEKTIGELELDPPVTHVWALDGKAERSVDSYRQSALTAARSWRRFTNKSSGERICKHKCDTHCVIVAVPNIHCSNKLYH